MTRRTHNLGKSLVGISLVVGLLASAWPAVSLVKAAPNVMTVETVVTKLVEQNRIREARLRQASYATPRVYRVKDSKGNMRAEAQVVMEHRAPGTKEFKVLSQTGSNFVYGRVLKPLLESEVEATAVRQRQESAITPDNYTFELQGEDTVDGHHCYLVQATPKRAAKYLFKGKIWIHSTDFAVVKIAAQPAKNPSFMIKQVDFVRRYQKVGEFWLPRRDESVTQVRLAGTNVLTIDYDNSRVAQLLAKK